MPDGGKTFKGPPGDTLSGRIGRDELGICLLQGFKLGKEGIVLPIADFRPVEHVVEVVVLANFTP